MAPYTTQSSGFLSRRFLPLVAILLSTSAFAFVACDSEYPPEFDDPGSTGGAGPTGGVGPGTGGLATGGVDSTGGRAATGGISATGGFTSTGGAFSTGGASSTGGVRTGGTSTGGTATGGRTGGTSTGGSAGGRGGSASTGGAGGGSGSCSSTTWSSFGMAFMTKYCVSCHSPFSTQSGVKAQASGIKSRAATGTTMPPGTPKPTSTERTQLGAWIDCGVP